MWYFQLVFVVLHDVYLSCGSRGKDTRYKFTDHLAYKQQTLAYKIYDGSKVIIVIILFSFEFISFFSQK